LDKRLAGLRSVAGRLTRLSGEAPLRAKDSRPFAELVGRMDLHTAIQPIAFSRPYMGDEEARAAADVIRSGWIVGGSRLAAFEERFAACCGARYGVGVSSWTAGAFLALYALGIAPGDEIIVPSLTFIATVNVIRHVGATPVFADIDEQTYNIDPVDAAQKIGPRTKAIMPVDQVGLPCDIDAIASVARKHGLIVIDDAACAFASSNLGRPVGSLAEVTIFSLHARKIVTTGEGGMIVTNDSALASRLRILRAQGMSVSDFARHGKRPTEFETYAEVGYNFRMTDIQGAIGLVQLDRLDEILCRRRHIAERYTRGLSGHPFIVAPSVPDDLEPNWQSYQVALHPGAPLSRNAVMDRLWDARVPTRRGVMASHLEPPYAPMNAALPVTERVADSTLQLPMHPALDERQVDHVLDAVYRLL
jgi:perosamine synthetase